MVRHHDKDFTWDGVDVLPYKEDGNLFKGVTRQTLHKGDPSFPIEVRYFEVETDGHSTLERHEHVHVVMIIRGSGTVFAGDKVTPIELHDVVHIPPMTWHQFRANQGEELGFLCVVSTERDRPQRPGSAELEQLRADPKVGEFIRV